MTATLVDTHCHLDSEGFQQDFEDVINRAAMAGVSHMVTIGTTLESSQAAILLANRYPCISAAVGIHPNYAAEAKPDDWENIERLASHPRVVGIGETGLDRYWKHCPLDLQREYFIRHIELSGRIRKPFIVHCREAEAEVVEVLNHFSSGGALSGVMHSFCGSIETMQCAIAAGLHISFAGMLTYRKNDELRKVAREVPRDRLLVETDAPYLAPLPNRGRRNEPSWVQYTHQCLAEVFEVSVEEMAEITTANACRLFQLLRPAGT